MNSLPLNTRIYYISIYLLKKKQYHKWHKYMELSHTVTAQWGIADPGVQAQKWMPADAVSRLCLERWPIGLRTRDVVSEERNQCQGAKSLCIRFRACSRKWIKALMCWWNPQEGVSKLFTLGGPQCRTPRVHLCYLDSLGLKQLGCWSSINPSGNAQFLNCWLTKSLGKIWKCNILSSLWSQAIKCSWILPWYL